MEAHIGYWPDDYDASADWVYTNKEAKYTEYKMTMEIKGEEHIYSQEEFALVYELFALVRGVIST